MSHAIHESILSFKYPHSITVLADKAGVSIQQHTCTNGGYVTASLGMSAEQAAELACWLMRGALYADTQAASKWMFELDADRMQPEPDGRADEREAIEKERAL